MQELEELGPPPWNTVEQVKVIGKWNAEFGGTTHKALPNPLLTMALSPAYSVRDAYSYIKGSSLSVHLMMDDLWRIDLFEQVPRLEVPVYIFQGHHDYQTPWPLAERYYEALVAPQGKELVWFEDSAHVPYAEEPEKFDREMLRVLQETYQKGQ